MLNSFFKKPQLPKQAIQDLRQSNYFLKQLITFICVLLLKLEVVDIEKPFEWRLILALSLHQYM